MFPTIKVTCEAIKSYFKTFLADVLPIDMLLVSCSESGHLRANRTQSSSSQGLHHLKLFLEINLQKITNAQ